MRSQIAVVFIGATVPARAMMAELPPYGGKGHYVALKEYGYLAAKDLQSRIHRD